MYTQCIVVVLKTDGINFYLLLLLILGTYEIDELDQAWLQLVNEKRKYKSNNLYYYNALSLSLLIHPFSNDKLIPSI